MVRSSSLSFYTPSLQFFLDFYPTITPENNIFNHAAPGGTWKPKTTPWFLGSDNGRKGGDVFSEPKFLNRRIRKVTG